MTKSTNQFGIPDDLFEAILEYFIEVVMETEDPDDLKRQLGITSERKKGKVLELVHKQEKFYDFQGTLLKICSRVQLMMNTLDQITKVQVQLPEVAQDQIATFKSIMAGGQWQMGLDTLINIYRDQLEVHATLDVDEEPDITPSEGGYDPIPREKYDPFRHE